MKKINPEAIQIYLKKLHERGSSASEIHKKLTSVDKFIDWAREKGYINKTQFKQVKETIANFKPINNYSTVFGYDQKSTLEPEKAKSINGKIPFKAKYFIRHVLKYIPLLSSKHQEAESKEKTYFEPFENNRNLAAFLGFILILLFVSILGAGLYSRFFKNTQTPFAYPATFTTPSSRFISFQGRLTDSLGNPITAATNVKFQLYSTSSGSTAVNLYTTGACSITPDQDGIFNSLIGSDCGPTVPNSVFTENTDVYLGVIVGTDAEMTPRQHIANVGYAINAETLQGLPPGTAASNIAFIDSSGTLAAAPSNTAVASTTQYLIKSTAKLTGAVGTAQTNLYAEYAVPTIGLSGGASNTLTNYFGDYVGLGVSLGTVTNYYANYVAAPTGAGTVSNKYAFVSEAGAGKVGIGTTAPTEALVLAGASDNISFSSATGPHQITTGGSTNLAFIPGGNVGIGTTVPINKLEVSGSADITGNLGVGTTAITNTITVGGNASIGVGYTGNAAPTNGLIVQGNAGIGSTGFTGATLDVAGTLRIGTTNSASSNTLCLGTNNIVSACSASSSLTGTGLNNYLARWTSATNLSTGVSYDNGTSVGIGFTNVNSSTILTVNGNIGIGTTNALAFLEIASTAPAGATATSYAFRLVPTLNGTLSSTFPQTTYYSFYNVPTIGITSAAGTAPQLRNLFIGYNGATIGTGETVVNSYGQYIAAPTLNGTATITNKYALVTEAGAGNIGLGTTIPVARLQITGNGTTTGLNFLAEDSNGADKFVILDNGNVGIGITAPTNKLDIVGAVSIGFNGSTAAPTNGLIVNGNVGIGNTGSTGYALDVSGTIRGQTLESSGPVKIGTTAAASSNNLCINSGIISACNASSSLTGVGVSNYLARWTSATNLSTGISYDNGSFVGIGYTASAGSPSLIVSGNVGIGTTAPGIGLDVQNGGIRLGNGSTFLTNAKLYNIYTDTGQLDLYNQSSKNVSLSGYNPSYLLKSFGIGSTAPRSIFHVQTTDPVVSIQNTNDGDMGQFFGETYSTGYFGMFSGSTNTPLFAMTTGAKVGTVINAFPAAPVFRNVLDDGSGNMTITGNVGVGTTSGANKLVIGGNESIGVGYTGLAAPTNGLIVQGNAGIGSTGFTGATLDVAGTIRLGTTNGAVNAQTLCLGTNNILSACTGGGGSITGTGVLNYLARWTSSTNISTGISYDNGTFVGIGYTAAASGALVVNGNIGIGTTSPGAFLEISSTVPAGATAVSYAFKLTPTINGTLTSTFPQTSFYSFYNVASIGITSAAGTAPQLRNLFIGYNSATIGTGETVVNSYGQYIAAPTLNGTATITNKYALVTEAGAGNIGFGTTVPTAKLHLLGNGTTTGFNLMVEDSSGADKFIIQDNGNVGIGYTAPANKLDIAGSISLGYTGIAAPTNGGIFAGNVGIATSAPGARLQINDTGGGDIIRLYMSASWNQGYYSDIGWTVAANASGKIQFGKGYSNNSEFQYLLNNTLIETMNTSAVGIFSSSPGSTLSVGGNAAIGASYAQLGAPSNGLIVQGNAGIGSTGFTGATLDIAGTLRIGTTNSASSNTLCLGTNNIVSACSASSSLTGVGATNYLARWTSATNLSTGISYDNGTFVGIGYTAAAGTTALIVNGNVGIGITNPAARLDVEGGVTKLGGGLLSPYTRVVVVDSGGKGDYTTLDAALAAISPSSTTPYSIELKPGDYRTTFASPTVMKSYVTVKGSGKSTIIGPLSGTGLAEVKLNNLYFYASHTGTEPTVTFSGDILFENDTVYMNQTDSAPYNGYYLGDTSTYYKNIYATNFGGHIAGYIENSTLANLGVKNTTIYVENSTILGNVTGNQGYPVLRNTTVFGTYVKPYTFCGDFYIYNSYLNAVDGDSDGTCDNINIYHSYLNTLSPTVSSPNNFNFYDSTVGTYTGVTSPSYTVNLYNSKVLASTGNTSALRNQVAGGTLGIQSPDTALVPAIIRGASGQTANILQIQNSTGNALDVITASGAFGIGTSNPVNKLDVSGALAIGTYAGVSSAPSNGAIISGNVGIGSTGFTGATLDVAGTLRVGTTNAAASNQICLDSNNMIASCSSSSNLTGLGVSNYIARWSSATNLSTGISYDNGTFVGIGYTAAGSGANFIVSGNVGIGTSSPLALLQVGVGSTTGLYVFSNGNIGIGTTSPGSTLDVVGSGIFSGLLGAANTLTTQDNGRIGSDLLIQTSLAVGNNYSSSMGTGKDGGITVPSSKNLNTTAVASGRAQPDAINFNIATALTAGDTTINLGTSPSGLAAGDEILIINLRGTSGNYANVGQYETHYITDVIGNILTLDTPLINSYDGTSQAIMVQRIPQYTTVTVSSGGTITATAFTTSSGKGGVIFFRATGAVTVNSGGSISANYIGYPGGAQATAASGGVTYNGIGGTGAGSSNGPGSSGQGGGGGSTGVGATSPGTTGGGGGGGGAGSGGGGSGGGGGGYGSTAAGGCDRLGVSCGLSGNGITGGRSGATNPNGTGNGGGGGGSYGSANLSQLFFGSGGAAGGDGAAGGGGGGPGGAGGGIIFVAASSLTVSGTVSANGNTGAQVSSFNGAGGGGAGGSIFLKAATATLGSTIVTSSAGVGGTGTAGQTGNGGSGSVGRIRVDSGNVTGTASPAYFLGTSDATIYASRSDTGNLLSLEASGTNLFLVNSNGNVGIGSTTPLAKLDIAGTLRIGTTNAAANTSYLCLGTNSIVSACSGGASVTGTGALNYLARWTSGTNISTGISYDNGSFLGVGYTAAGSGANFVVSGNVGIGTSSPLSLLQVGVGSTTGLYVLSSGNVGIGVASPTRKLDISANASGDGIQVVNSTSNGSNLYLANGVSGNNGLGTIQFGGNPSPLVAFAAKIQADGAEAWSVGHQGSTLSFWTTQNSTSTMVERLRIDNTGNVGIGTTAPVNKLDINGSVAIGSLPGNSLPQSNSLYVSGNVGIGTTNPSAALHVNGDAWANRFMDTSNSAYYIDPAASGAGNYNLVFSTGLAYFAGNVGIGVSLPVNKFDVAGSAAFGTYGGTAATASNSVIFGGNIGIGTTNAVSQLQLVATATTGTASQFIGNSLTSGTLLSLASTNQNITSGGLLALDFQPAGSSTAFTGDLLSVNVGPSAVGGNLLNLKNNGSSIFSVSQNLVTSAIPAQFNAAGDVSIAYDLLMTNQVSSNIKSLGPITLEAGESFESNDLTLRSYNNGNIVLDTPGSIILGGGTSPTIYVGQGSTASHVIFADNANTAAVKGQTGTWSNGEVHFGSISGGQTAANGRIFLKSNGSIFSFSSTNNLIADYSEYMPQETAGSLEPGDIVNISQLTGKAMKGNLPYDSHIAGAVTTAERGTSYNDLEKNSLDDYSHKNDPAWANVGMVGQVYVKVNLENGSIKAGDPITLSTQAGIGMKATMEGMIVGQALQPWDGSQTRDNRAPQQPLPSGVGMILVYVHPTYQGGSFLPSEVLVKAIQGFGYQVQDVAGKIISKTGAFANIIVANVNAGVANIDSLITRNFIATEKIQSPIIETGDIVATGTADLAKIKTDEINPKNNDLVINLSGQPSQTSPTMNNAPLATSSGPLAKLVIKGLEGKTVATIDAGGNATFSGTLAASGLSANEASISGTLAAGNVQSNSLNSNEASISGTLIAKNIESDNINEIQRQLAEIRNQPLANPQFYQSLSGQSVSLSSTQPQNNLTGSSGLQPILTDLTVTGTSNLYNLSVANSLTVGSIFAENDSILSLSWDLKLSALSTVRFFDDAVVISKDGNLTTRGSVIAQGGVKTGEIRALNNGQDINVVLQQDTEASKSAHFNIADALGNINASVDASGAATFKSLGLEKYLDATSSAALLTPSQNFAKNGLFVPAIETKSESAGVGQIPANQTEVVIYNGSLSDSSLVYLTSTTATPTNLTVTAKETCKNNPSPLCKPYFKVTTTGLSTSTTPFNWLIVK